MQKTQTNQACEEASRRPIIVHVRIKPDKTFEMTSTEIPVGKVKHGGQEVPMITFDNNHGGTYSDGFQVKFKLQDQTGEGYGFFLDPDKNPADPNDAMWVECIGPKGFCPQKVSQWEGFVPTDVTDNRKTLIVDNPNDHLQYFGFALHFSKDNEKKPSLTFDPIGDDRNGQAR